jgi:hypothetical protein
MIDQPESGLQGTPLLPEETVLRLADPPEDLPMDFWEAGEIDESAFFVLGPDRKSDLQALSVWAVRLTSIEQVRQIRGLRDEDIQIVFYLNVGDIRALKPAPDSPEREYLNVVWDLLKDIHTGQPDLRPGAKGHAGMTGLGDKSGLNKTQRRSMRSQLVDLVNTRKTLRLHPDRPS